MIKLKSGEIWKQMQFEGYKNLKKKYAASNLGRAASYVLGLEKDGNLLNGSLTSGYRTLNLHVEDGNGTIYFHREIAKLFCKKKSPKESSFCFPPTRPFSAADCSSAFGSTFIPTPGSNTFATTNPIIKDKVLITKK